MKQGNLPRQPKRPTLKIHEQKGTLTIQTQEVALQAIFNSPVLQAANYIQQFQKYSLRGALSAINLKIDQYDTYYTRAKDHIEEVYNTLTYRSVAMVQDLLLSLRLVKIQMWRQQTAIANGLRTHLYQKNLDPYGFRAGQFDPDIATICDSRGVLKESIIEELSQKLKQFQSQNMENMFSGKVLQPYLAQNKDHNEVDPSSMYASLLGQIKLKMEKTDQTLMKRHACIQEQILKFMQFTTEHNLRTQKIAQSIIKRYNQCSGESHDFLLYSVSPVVDLIEKKESFNADDLFTVKQYRSELKPAFANRNHNVQFKVSSKLFDPETGNLVEVQQGHPQENYREWDRYGCIQAPAPRVSPFDSFSQRKKNNPKEFYQLREFQKQKYRQEQLRMREKDRNDREKQKQKQKISSKKIIRIMPTPPPWAELTQHDFPFLYFYVQRRSKENAFWQSRQKETEAQELMYSVKKQKTSQSSMFRTQQKSKSQQELPRQAQVPVHSQQACIQFQIKRREEQSVRLIRIQKLVQSRCYEKFMNLSKWQIKNPPFCDNSSVSRYGITFNINFDHIRDLREVDIFFYRYFKQRYYRENENVKENADNPIIFLDSSKYNMNSTAKLVSQYVGSIVKKVQSIPFFVVWSDDILVYRLTTTKQGKVANFEFYPYGNTSNSQRLMYQLRRRINMNIKEDIKEHYGKTTDLEKLFSKIQVTHRAIFDRHREMPDMAKSATKGREIVREIFQSLRNGKM